MSGDDHITPDPQGDRMGLEAFDHVDVPEQWREINARAKSPSPLGSGDGDDGSARPWTRWVMAAAAVVLVVVAVVAIAVRSDEGSAPATLPPDTFAPPATSSPAPETTPTPTTGSAVSAPPPTTATPTSIPPTSAPATSAPAASPPGTSTPATPGDTAEWTVACTDVAGQPNAHEHDSRLDEFTALGAAPALDVVAPKVVVSTGELDPIIESALIPGGFLVWVRPPDWSPPEETVVSSRLIALDLDGSLRWRRCINEPASYGLAVASPDREPTTAWVTMADGDGNTSGIRGFDLETGADRPFEGAVGGMSPQARSDDAIVFGLPWSSPPPDQDDRLVVVDTLTGDAESIPYPTSSLGKAPDLSRFEMTDVLTAYDGAAPIEVFDDGAWTTDPEVLRRLAPRIEEPFGEPWELRLIDGAGDVLWTVGDFHGIMREGFRGAVTEDVVLMVECVGSPDPCGWVGEAPPPERLVAYDAATGTERWSLPGGRAVPILTDATAIVTADDVNGDGAIGDYGYVQYDLATGERVEPERVWPDRAFAGECCGAALYTHVARDGAAVFATDLAHVRIWLPPDMAQATTTVDLGGDV